jgi:hypothetical protein
MSVPGTDAGRHSVSAPVSIPVVYQGTSISLGFRADILVADAVIPEIKALLPSSRHPKRKS